MAVLSRDDFFSHLQERIGTDVSDEAMQFIEDMTDTYNDMETRANGNSVDWEQRYNDLNESWKAKYKRRFFSSGGRSVIPQDDVDEDDETGVKRASTIAIKDLFTND